jgi:hypothetical protein
VHVARPGGRRRRPGCPLRVAAPLGALVRPSYRRHGFADPSLPSPRLRGLPTGVPSRAGARDRSHRLRPLSGPASSCPGSDLPAGAAPPGVLFPFDVLSERVRITRGCLPRLVPSSSKSLFPLRRFQLLTLVYSSVNPKYTKYETYLVASLTHPFERVNSHPEGATFRCCWKVLVSPSLSLNSAYAYQAPFSSSLSGF